MFSCEFPVKPELNKIVKFMTGAKPTFNLVLSDGGIAFIMRASQHCDAIAMIHRSDLSQLVVTRDGEWEHGAIVRSVSALQFIGFIGTKGKGYTDEYVFIMTVGSDSHRLELTIAKNGSNVDGGQRMIVARTEMIMEDAINDTSYPDITTFNVDNVKLNEFKGISNALSSGRGKGCDASSNITCYYHDHFIGFEDKISGKQFALGSQTPNPDNDPSKMLQICEIDPMVFTMAKCVGIANARNGFVSIHCSYNNPLIVKMKLSKIEFKIYVNKLVPPNTR